MVATGPEAGSASVGGASSDDGAMLMGTASVTGGGAEVEESSILLVTEDFKAGARSNKGARLGRS